MEPKTYVYKQVGECRIHADIYQPQPTSVLRPLVMFIHGGGLIYGSRKDINPKQLELYLNAGYVIVSIDYRLAPEAKLPAIITDLQDAFGWIYDHGTELCSADAQRMAVVGHSAGGYLTLMAGFCVRPRALVSFYGYGDIVGTWYREPDPFYCQQPVVSEEQSGKLVEGPVISEPSVERGKDNFYLYCRHNGLWPQEVGGHDPRTVPSFFVLFCPLRNVTPDYPPTLLLHGDQDTDVPYEQSVLMAEMLSRHRVEHGLITTNGGGHGFDRDMSDPFVTESFATVLAFLENHIGTGTQARR